MKKFLLLTLASFCSLIIFAQSDDDKKLEQFFGFYLGPNFYCYRGDNFADESKLKVGFQAGVLYNFAVSDDIYLQPEVNLSLIGARYEGYMGSQDQKVNMMYANVVLIGQYHTNSGVYFELGPQVGYLVSAKSKYDDNSYDIKDNYKKGAFGVNAGLGYELNKNWRIGARYTLGLSQMLKDEESDAKYNGASVNVRYLVGR